MTIERDDPAFWRVTCDVCGVEEAFDMHTYETFNAVVAAMKRNGYRIKKIAGEWVHECPACKE